MRWEPNQALAEILAKDATELGVDVFDHGPQAAPTPGPPVQYEPLTRPTFPRPDWRAEKQAAAEEQP